MSKVQEWMRSLPAVAQDLAFALALSAYTQWELSVAEVVQGPMWAQRLAFLMMTGAIAGRRATPLAAAVVGAAGMAVQTVLGVALAAGGFLAVIALTHSVALRCPRRAAVAGLVMIMAAVHLYDVLYPEEFSLPDLIANAAIFLLVWALGRGARRWRHRTQELRERAAAQQRQQEERSAIAQERASIARELHDIVAHAISVMVLQAGAARQVLNAQPQRASGPLLAVEDSGRQALDEMHRLLGILRRDDDGLAVASVATLDRLPELVDHMRATGLDVEVTIEGEPHSLPSSLEQSAYRIVQEALTNTLKHSAAKRARVLIRYTSDALDLDVSDDGAAARQGATTGAGQGLVGMRERAALFGGELSAGPDANGTWAVRARLPVTHQAA